MLSVLLTTLFASAALASQPIVWPAPPAAPRVEYVREIGCDDIKPEAGFFGKVKRLLTGEAEHESLMLPFDLLVTGESLFMTCQNLAAVVEVDLQNRTYRLLTCSRRPLAYPVALCDGGGVVFVTDSENGTVYRIAEGTIEPLITSGLLRPTGIVAAPEARRLYVVDTGDHTVKVFDYDGNPTMTIGGPGGDESGLHFPTFATTDDEGAILVNDALNYRIKRFDTAGTLLSEFGTEGDGPGAFARPKGVATDSYGHIYVVDNLFDNIQVFSPEGQVLLVIGTGGNQPGQFWSPGGIDIVNDTIYVADTYNNRVQVLHFLGDEQ